MLIFRFDFERTEVVAVTKAAITALSLDMMYHQVNNTRTVCAGGNKGGFCNDNLGANAVLSLHSFTNHSDFCLSFLLTYRDFPGGVVGMAWVAGPSGTMRVISASLSSMFSYEKC